MKLRSIVVEDESLSRATLVKMLETKCAESIEIIGESDNVKEAIRLINKTNPDLLFLDIKLGTEVNGAFEILRAFPQRDFNVIFTTGEKKIEKILDAYKRKNTISYLLKPISISDVVESVAQAKEQFDNKNIRSQIDHLEEMIKEIHSLSREPKIEIPIKSGAEFVPVSEIIMFRASRNNCYVFRTEKEAIHSTKSLGHFSIETEGPDFFKTCKSYIVNLQHVEKVMNIEGVIYLTNNCQAPLSKELRPDFYNALRNYQARLKKKIN
jgi:two-component system LytT family response regulator